MRDKINWMKLFNTSRTFLAKYGIRALVVTALTISVVSTVYFYEHGAPGHGKFSVSKNGVFTLAGGQIADITTLAGTAPHALTIQPGNNTSPVSVGAGLTLQAGNGSGSKASTGGLLTLKGGDATGGSRTGGGVSIDSGSGTTGGTITIGGTNAATVAIGRTGQALQLKSLTRAVANGVLYIKDASGTVEETAASTGAQCLQTLGAGFIPSWGACSTTPTLQNVFDTASGNTITANGTSLILTQQGTASALILNDTNPATNIAIDIQSGGVSKFTISELGNITSASFNTTATGINATAIGATTPSTGAFTTLSATGAITGSNLSGINTGDQTITLTGDVTGSGTGSFGTTISANAVALTTDTTGNYVAGITAGNGLTGDATGEGSTPTLAVASANGGIVVNADNIALSLQAATPAGASSNVSSGSGLEILGGGLSLLQGCSDGQILKWTEASGLWSCAADNAGGGTLSFDSITAGTNTSALVIGTGGSLSTSGTGTIDATSLGGATFGAPGAIGSGTAAAGTFTTLTANTSITDVGLSTAGVVTNTAAGLLGTLAGTTTTLLHGNAAGLPTFSSVVGGDLAANITISTTGNIATTGAGTITSAGLLTASNGLTLATGALNLTATSGALALSGLSAFSIDSGANALTITSSNFNTTATGINSTAIGATTPGTGAFTTLASSDASTIGTGASLTNTFGSGASSINTIGSTTTPGALTLHGATTLDNTLVLSALGGAGTGITALCLDGATFARTCGSNPSAVTLQQAYNAGNTITTTDARDIAFTFADTATDTSLTLTQLGTAPGLVLSATATGLTSNALSVTTASTATVTNGLVRFNFSGIRTTAGNGFQIDDASTSLATVMAINANSLTTGNALAISATLGTFTGNALSVTTGTSAALTNGLVFFNFTGNRTAAGTAAAFQVTDASTTSATTMGITANSLTTGTALTVATNGLIGGTGLSVTSTSTSETGPLILAQTASTATVTNGLVRFNFSGIRTTAGNGFQIDDASTTLATTMKINAISLTTGTALAISAGAGTFTGNALLVTTAGSGVPINGGLVRFNFTGNRTAAGVGFQIDDASTTSATAMKINANSLTTGTALAVAANGLTSGTGLSVTSTSAAETGPLILAQTASTATVTNGLVRFNFSGIRTTAGVGFQIDDISTTLATVMKINANSLTTGIALNISDTAAFSGTGLVQIVATNAATTGAALYVNSPGAIEGTNVVAGANSNSPKIILEGNGFTAGPTNTTGSFSIQSTPLSATTAKLMFAVTGWVASANVFSIDQAGAIRSASTDTNSVAPDIAENVPVSDQTVEAGDLVVVDETAVNFNARTDTYKSDIYDVFAAKKSSLPYDPKLLGVISTDPGIIMHAPKDTVTTGLNSASSDRLLALAGRTSVKISAENGPIHKGDFLTSSSTPGVAMKATHAGPVLGQALENWDSGSAKDRILVLVERGYYNGESLTDFVANAGSGTADPNSSDSIGQQVLAKFLTNQTMPTTLSSAEILTGRVAAGLEIITPKITADQLITNSIKPSTGTDINLELGQDGRFVVKNPAGGEAIVFDASGNAKFTGTITADKIKANQVEGLTAPSPAPVASQNSNSPSPTGLTQLGDITINSGTITLDLTVNGTLFASGGLKVAGPAEFSGTSIFNNLATFNDKAIFAGDVSFLGRAVFSSDSGGFATVHTGDQQVHVAFTKPYGNLPVVTLSVKNGQFVTYAYKDLANDGFTIVLKDPALADVEFAWAALPVQSQ